MSRKQKRALTLRYAKRLCISQQQQQQQQQPIVQETRRSRALDLWVPGGNDDFPLLDDNRDSDEDVNKVIEEPQRPALPRPAPPVIPRLKLPPRASAIADLGEDTVRELLTARSSLAGGTVYSLHTPHASTAAAAATPRPVRFHIVHRVGGGGERAHDSQVKPIALVADDNFVLQRLPSSSSSTTRR